MNASAADIPEQKPLGVASGETFVIPVLSEQIEIRVLREHTGTLRLRKVVHEDAVPLGVTGVRETVETKRVPVNQVVDSTRAPWHEGETLVIPVYEERLVRQLFLLEEIHLLRRRELYDASTTASLRREEVIVERLDPATGQWLPEAG